MPTALLSRHWHTEDAAALIPMWNYPTVKKTNFTPVTNNTKNLLNSSTKADNLRRGVFWLEVEYTVLSIYHLAASSCGLHLFELHSLMKSPLNSNLSSSICTHTQASFNTMWYKGRDSASGIDRKLSIIRPGATSIVAP